MEYYDNESALWWDRLSNTERENALDRMRIKFEHGVHNKYPYLYFKDSIRKKITRFYRQHFQHVHAKRGFKGTVRRKHNKGKQIGIHFPNIRVKI